MKNLQDRCLVSIVLSAFNGERYLEEQVKSIMNQTYRNLEIIIIDDNSTDKSLGIANKLKMQDSRIKVYRNAANLGLVPNFLKGASFSSGELICFCDQDDWWSPDKIEVLKQLLEKSKENMLAYSDLEICDERLQCIKPSFWKSFGLRPKKGCLKELSFLKNITPGCTMMFRKKVKDMLIVVSSDVPFMHDHLALILSSGLGRIVYSKEKLVKYRQHEANNIGAFYNSVIDKERIIRELREKVNYFKKLSLKGLVFNLDRMLIFCDCLHDGGMFKRLSFIDCYLFLRNDTSWDKFLGIMECLMPKSYARARKMKKSPHLLESRNNVTLYMWIKRTLFTIWIIVVLYYFTNEFIMRKLVKFLGYIK